MLISKRIQQFISERDMTKQGKKQYKMVLSLFYKWANGCGLNVLEITKMDMLNYKQHLFEKNKALLTIANYLTVLKLYFRWCESESLHKNITTGIKTEKKYIGFKKDPLNEKQSNKLLTSIKTNTMMGLRNKAIINLMIVTGLRQIEVVRLNIGDIKPHKNKWQLLIIGKGEKEKVRVSLPNNSMELIHQYLLQRKDKFTNNDPLFVSISHRNKNKRLTTNSLSRFIKEAMRNIGINNKAYTAHSLRHTCAYLLLRSGYDIEEVSYKLRHRNISTTQFYTRAIEEEIRLNNDPGQHLENILNIGKKQAKTSKKQGTLKHSKGKC